MHSQFIYVTFCHTNLFNSKLINNIIEKTFKISFSKIQIPIHPDSTNLEKKKKN